MPLFNAQYQHIKWVTHLIAWVENVNNTAPPPDISNHAVCRFGHWYNDEGKTHYGQLSAFRAIETTHVEVHNIGAKIEQLMLEGKQHSAQKLCSSLNQASKILQQLAALQKQVLSTY